MPFTGIPYISSSVPTLPLPSLLTAQVVSAQPYAVHILPCNPPSHYVPHLYSLCDLYALLRTHSVHSQYSRPFCALSLFIRYIRYILCRSLHSVHAPSQPAVPCALCLCPCVYALCVALHFVCAFCTQYLNSFCALPPLPSTTLHYPASASPSAPSSAFYPLAPSPPCAPYVPSLTSPALPFPLYAPTAVPPHRRSYGAELKSACGMHLIHRLTDLVHYRPSSSPPSHLSYAQLPAPPPTCQLISFIGCAHEDQSLDGAPPNDDINCELLMTSLTRKIDPTPPNTSNHLPYPHSICMAM